MKYVLVWALGTVASLAHAQCVEEELTRSPYCFSAMQAAYFCQNTGSTDVGFEQALSCLEASMRVRGKLAPDDRDSCLGGTVEEDASPDLASSCVSR